MDLGSIFLIISLFLLVALYVARPLFERQTTSKTSVSSQEHAVSSLLAERDRVINSLQELDFDFTLGKVPEEDYPTQRAALLQRGADVLRQLDALNPVAATKSPLVSPEDALEAAIAARREAQAPSVTKSAAESESDDPLEVIIASRRRARREKSAGFCPKCGKPLQKSDRFCPKCGNALTPSAT